MAKWKAKQTGDLSASLRSLQDALDFEHSLDRTESGYRRGKALDADVRKKLVAHRVALGLIPYPKLADYLSDHYEQLESRIFEKKRITDWNKRWYEFHRPRRQQVMLQTPKLISPRLARKVRFTLDRIGIIPQDSCVGLVRTKNTASAWKLFRKQLSQSTGGRISDMTILKVILGFANSAYAQRVLTTGRQKTPKGSYTVKDDFLNDLRILPLKSGKKFDKFLEAVDLLCGFDTSKHATAQRSVDRIVEEAMDSATAPRSIPPSTVVPIR